MIDVMGQCEATRTIGLSVFRNRTLLPRQASPQILACQKEIVISITYGPFNQALQSHDRRTYTNIQHRTCFLHGYHFGNTGGIVFYKTYHVMARHGRTTHR